MYGGGYNPNQSFNQEHYYTRPPPQVYQNQPNAPPGQVFYPAPNCNSAYMMPPQNIYGGIPNVAPGSFLMATPQGVVSDWPPQYGGRQPPPLMSIPVMHPYHQHPMFHGYNPYSQRTHAYPQQGFNPAPSGLPVPYGMPLVDYAPQPTIDPTGSYQAAAESQEAGSNFAVCDSRSFDRAADVSPSDTANFRINKNMDTRRGVHQDSPDSTRSELPLADTLSRLPSVSAPNLYDVSEDGAANSMPVEVSRKASMEPYERTQSDANLRGANILQNRLSFHHKMASQRHFESVESAASSAAETVPSSGYHSGSSIATVTSQLNDVDELDDTLSEEVSIGLASTSASSEMEAGSANFNCIMPEGLSRAQDLKGITFGWSSPSSNR